MAHVKDAYDGRRWPTMATDGLESSSGNRKRWSTIVRHRQPLFAIVGAFSLTGCMTQIPPSHVGIKFNGASGISQRLLRPELVYRGWNDQIVVYPTAIRNASYVQNAHEGERVGDDSLKATTSEGSKLPVDLTVAYHVDPANVLTAFQNFGTEDLTEVQRTFVRTTAAYGLDIVTGTRSIFALTSRERASIGPEVKAVVAPILEEYGITVDDVAIGEIHPDQEIQARVAESVGIRAELDTKKTELERAKIEAQTVETEARKQAELNELLASQSGDQAIAVKKLEILRKAIDKWKSAGGKPPMVGDGTVPFTDVKLQ